MASVHPDSQAVSTGKRQAMSSKPQLSYSLPLAKLTPENQDEVLSTTIGLIAEQFGADHGYILLENGSDQLKVAASKYRTSPTDPLVTFSSSVTDEVHKSGKGILVEDAMSNEKFFGDPNFQRFNIKSAICAPLKRPQSSFGVVYLDSSEALSKWSREDLTSLDSLAEYIALAVENVKLQLEKQKNQHLIAAGQAVLQISHSVKNTLQLVSGAAEVIDFGLRTDEIHRVKRSWDVLKPNLERIKKFTLDMLDFSKARKLEIGRCDFNKIIQEAVESLRSQLKQKKTKLHIRIDKKIPMLQLDCERIHVLIANLILNAIDVADQDNGIVTVETKFIADKETIELSVTDNGPGISDAEKAKIFLPFQSTKNKFGTGLGLPIAKNIVTQHNGCIDIESEPGKGTTFRVTLPAKNAQPS